MELHSAPMVSDSSSLSFAACHSTIILFTRSMRMVRSMLQPAAEPAVIYDRNGSSSSAWGQQGEIVRLEEGAEHLKEAVVAVEDARLPPPGRGCGGRLAAFLGQPPIGRKAQGASTITMQACRNIFLYPDKTWSRKIQEAFLAMALESQYSKDEILEMYLNQTYFGGSLWHWLQLVSISTNPYRSWICGERPCTGLPQAPSQYLALSLT